MELDGELLTRCPLRPTLDNPASFRSFLTLYSWYKKGYMPESGSYLDQAAAFIAMVEIMDAAAEKARDIKDKMDARRKGKKP